MRPLYIAGTGSFLPPRRSAAEAVAAGAYRPDRAADSGIESVTVSTELAAPEMAVRAGRSALAAAENWLGGGVRSVLHTHSDLQGARFWEAAPYVALHTVGDGVPGYEVLQSCNGGLACLQLGAALLAGTDDSVLITAADRFDSEGVDRWNADPQAVLGDGAAALVLSTVGGRARLLSLATACDNRLEGESRGAAFTGRVSAPLDFERLREGYLRAGMPLLTHLLAMKDVLDTALKRAFDEAGCLPSELAYLVPATATHPQLRSMLVNLIQLPEERTTWSFGRTTGHVGAADHLLGLDHLLSSGKVGPGDRVLLLGGGTGFSCTCAIVEVLR